MNKKEKEKQVSSMPIIRDIWMSTEKRCRYYGNKKWQSKPLVVVSGDWVDSREVCGSYSFYFSF